MQLCRIKRISLFLIIVINPTSMRRMPICFARIHLNNLASRIFPINRGVRQGDPVQPKLFTTIKEEIFKKADTSEGIQVNGEHPTNKRFADDVALVNKNKKNNKQMKTFQEPKLRKCQSLAKVHKGKTK